ncbi:MAG: hypothetical protein LBS72_02260 [Oscillospiraceae bacterium]|jgi:hypothetical protein|nr:hypothetical protein [Oscillospiraceae bacterium]
MSQFATANIRRNGHGGWKQEEVSALQQAIEQANQNGEPLRGVFDHVSKALGRKPNSIRNYYYAQLKNMELVGSQRAMPFKTFDEDEMRDLLKSILEGCAQGLSVRACVVRMSEGDKSRMLRYQNKYRSLIKTRPEMVREVIDELERKGVRCRDPYQARSSNHVSMAETESRLRESGDPALQQLLSGLNALLSRSNNSEQSLAIERMQARQDILLSELNSTRNAYQNLRSICGPLSHILREFCGTNAAGRRSNLTAFCDDMSAYADALDQALEA